MPSRAGDLDQVQLGPVQRPVGGEVAAVLVAVGVAEHDLLHVAAGGDAATRYSGWSSTAVERRRRRACRSSIVSNSGEMPTGQVGPPVGARVEQADLLEQDGDLEHVADRLAHADHVVRDGRAGRAAATCSAAATQHVELAAGGLGELGVRAHQRTAHRQLAGQQLDPRRLVERGVVVAHPGPGQQLADDLLVDGGVLPHVEPAQVEAEHLDGLAQPQQPVVGQRAGAVAAQRRVDDVEVGAQLVGRRRRAAAAASGAGPGHPAEHRRAPWRPAGRRCRRAPGGRARRRGTASRRRRPRPARSSSCGRRDQPVGHRQLVAQRARSSARWWPSAVVGLPAGGPAQRVGGDERVAVAVAADPRAGQQHRPAAAGRRRASARPAPAAARR